VWRGSKENRQIGRRTEGEEGNGNHSKSVRLVEKKCVANEKIFWRESAGCWAFARVSSRATTCAAFNALDNVARTGSRGAPIAPTSTTRGL
jgi:hypothetical protein